MYDELELVQEKYKKAKVRLEVPLKGAHRKNIGGFQWFKNHKAGVQPPDAIEFIHSQTAFVAIFCVS